MTERHYFGTDGVRGLVGEPPITPELVLKLGWAAGRVLAADTRRAGGRPAVLIGKDTRISGYLLEAALEAGLSAAGVDVLLCGPLPTPGIAYLTRALRLDAGIVISASHNPYDDNGIKFFSGRRRQAARRDRARDRGGDGDAARLRALGRAGQGASHRGRGGPLHRVLQGHLSRRPRPQGLEDRRRLRARRGLPRRAAGVPRARRGGGGHRRRARRHQHQRRRRRHASAGARPRRRRARRRHRHRARRRRRPADHGRPRGAHLRRRRAPLRHRDGLPAARRARRAASSAR